MIIPRQDQFPGCLSKRILVVVCGFVLVNLLILTFCVWSLGIPATLALKSVPVPSDADMQIDNRQFFDIGEDGPKAEMMYYVYRPWPEVVDFYRAEMSKRGWTLEQEYTTEAKNLLSSERRYHVVCMVFRRTPIFVVNIESSGVVENNQVLAKTTVTVDASPNGKDFCR